MQITTLLGQTEAVPWLKPDICLSSPDWVHDFTAMLGKAGNSWCQGSRKAAPLPAAQLHRQGMAASSFLLQRCSTQPDTCTWRAAGLRQLVCQAERHRGRAAARRSSREQAFTQALITVQQDKSLGRLLPHFQHPPDDFFLTLELPEITGGTVLPTRGLASQVLWPATPDKGSPIGALILMSLSMDTTRKKAIISLHNLLEMCVCKQQPSKLPKSMFWHGKELGGLFLEKWHKCAYEETRPNNTAPVLAGLYSSVTWVAQPWHEYHLLLLVITLLKQISLRLSNPTIHITKLTLCASTIFFYPYSLLWINISIRNFL